jgi:hypothetical protein
MNPLYEQMQAGQNNFLQSFMQFKQSFKGNPQEQIQQLLNSGKVTQAEYNAAVQKAQMLRKILGM